MTAWPANEMCPSTASTVTSESTVTTSASEAPSLGSCKGLKPSSTSTPPPCQRDERRPGAHYMNVTTAARAFPDPVHASINGVGLPPPRPKSTKPGGSHVSTPAGGSVAGSLGRRSATPLRTDSRNGYRNGADAGALASGGYGAPSSRAHSPMMMTTPPQSSYPHHHLSRAAHDGGDLLLSSTPKVHLLRTNHREGVVYADLALLNNTHKAAAVVSSRREGPPTEYATLKFHQTLDNAAAGECPAKLMRILSSVLRR
ncbi:uncharacterized protein LOC144094373 [Amblyomma americanum]